MFINYVNSSKFLYKKKVNLNTTFNFKKTVLVFSWDKKLFYKLVLTYMRSILWIWKEIQNVSFVPKWQKMLFSLLFPLHFQKYSSHILASNIKGKNRCSTAKTSLIPKGQTIWTIFLAKGKQTLFVHLRFSAFLLVEIY